MAPGPTKSFDPDEALLVARDVFWRHGYDGTGIAQLERALGVGRKSLYDTFGNKRALFHRVLQVYADTVIERICSGLASPRGDALGNLERVLGRLASHHGAPESLGCLLGVAAAQAAPEDDELASLLKEILGRLEDAFAQAVRAGQVDGALRSDLRPRDVARQLVTLTQGIALLGRVLDGPARTRAVVRTTLSSLSA